MAGNVNGTIYVFDQFEGEEVVSECLVRCQGTWTQLTPQAAWFPRHGHRLVAAPGVSRKETHSKETHIMSFHISAQGRLRNPRQRGRRHGRKPSLADTGCFFLGSFDALNDLGSRDMSGSSCELLCQDNCPLPGPSWGVWRGTRQWQLSQCSLQLGSQSDS